MPGGDRDELRGVIWFGCTVFGAVAPIWVVPGGRIEGSLVDRDAETGAAVGSSLTHRLRCVRVIGGVGLRVAEWMVFVANVAAVGALAMSWPAGHLWVGAVAIAACLVGGAQMVVEGARWQMLPAYGLAVVVALIASGTAAAARQPSQEGLPTVLRLGIGAAALTASVTLPLALPVFRFPRPTGPFAVGTVIEHWVDAARDGLGVDGERKQRELMAQVWYPADPGSGGRPAPYIPEGSAVTRALGRVAGLPGFFLGHLRRVASHAVQGLPAASDEAAYPVVVFLSGRSGFRSSNMFQIHQLASHGYVVVGLDQPGASAAVQLPDGRLVQGLPGEVLQPLVRQSVAALPQTPTLKGRAMPDGVVPYLAQDVAFALDRLASIDELEPCGVLAGKLDLDRVGVFGVSLGGTVAAEVCLRDPRPKACLAMDASMPAGVAAAGLSQPTMFLTRDAETMRLERRRAGGWPEEAIALTIDSMRAVYAGLAGDGYHVQIPGAFHLNFTDVPLWLPAAKWMGLTGPVRSRRVFDLINAYTLAFFDRYLKGRAPALLERSSVPPSEVLFESRGP